MSSKKTMAIIFALMICILVPAGCAKGESSTSTTATSNSTTMKSEETSTENATTTSKTGIYVGEIIPFGSYEQDNNPANGKEIIDWRVLEVDNDKALLLSEKILDAKPYSEVPGEATWETCTLRSWLNNDFYNTAFSATEKSSILTSTVVNENHPYYGTQGGNNTNDKLFLLSFSEIINQAYGFNSELNYKDTARQALGTQFSINNGLFTANESGDLGNNTWWLRSPGSDNSKAGLVDGTGYVFDGDSATCIIQETTSGVRPAFWINLNSITVT